jgi:D-3-phosphoglycerate dehydrogenase
MALEATPVKVLLLENIHPVAKTILEKEGLTVQLEKSAWSEEQLKKAVKEFDLLGIRSKTQITPAVIQEASKIITFGAFCIGTNQIDLEGANRFGIPVFNAPYSNTRSVAELIIAEIVMLSRNLGDKIMKAHSGVWEKSAVGSKEVRGKILGIIGYGHIGSQVSIMAEAMGLKVIFYDVIKKLPLGNAHQANSIDEVLENSDFVTLHVPETPETMNMIGELQIKRMKKGACLLNASRGTVVEIQPLALALKTGHLAGAAIDVFPYEPSKNEEEFVTELQNLPNVLLTPHIGGSTEEAQEAIGVEVAESFLRFLKHGSTTGAVNFPRIDVPQKKSGERILNVHKNEPGVLRDINKIVSDSGANITAQYLSTDNQIGYLVLDMEKGQARAAVQEIEKLKPNIRTRVV